MLRISITAIGKDKAAWLAQGAAHFEKLLGRHAKIEWNVLPSKTAGSMSGAQIRNHEADLILKKWPEGRVIALSDSGSTYDSHQFAQHLQHWQTICKGKLAFVIGGPYGLEQRIIDAADEVLSLSPLTFSHQVVRLVLLEQLFRGFSILANTDYHK